MIPIILIFTGIVSYVLITSGWPIIGGWIASCIIAALVVGKLFSNGQE